MLAGRAPLLPSSALVCRSPFVPVLFLSLLALGLGFVSSPFWCPNHPSADQDDINAIIEDVAKDAAAEAEKVAAEESAKGTAEDATKGPAGEPGKAATEEEVVDDQPSSSAAPGSGRYLRVIDDLFVHLPGVSSSRAPVEGEVFDEEVLPPPGSRSSTSRAPVATALRRSGFSRPWAPISGSSRRSTAPA